MRGYFHEDATLCSQVSEAHTQWYIRHTVGGGGGGGVMVINPDISTF